MLVVGPNLSLDETVSVAALRVGTIHRVGEVLRLAGGKGANVARALGVLGAEPLLVGFVGGTTGHELTSYLDAEGIVHRLVRTQAATRTCFSIVDASAGTQTEFYGAGGAVTTDEVAALLRTVAEQMAGHAWVVLTGSLPPGAPEDLYAQMIEMAHARGVRTLLDARGAALTAGIAATPTIVKINASELAGVTGETPHGPREVAACAAHLLARGARTTLTTLGQAGAVLVAPGARWHVYAAARPVISPVGSGDAAAAGMIAALEHGADLLGAARAAVAAGTANALHLGAGRFTRAEFDEVLAACETTELT